MPSRLIRARRFETASISCCVGHRLPGCSLPASESLGIVGLALVWVVFITYLPLLAQFKIAHNSVISKRRRTGKTGSSSQGMAERPGEFRVAQGGPGTSGADLNQGTAP